MAAAAAETHPRATMKLGLFCLSLALLSACTVQNVDLAKDGGSSAPSPPPAESASDGGGSNANGNADASTSSGSVPAELVGKSWSWVTSAGGNVLTFSKDGKYTSDVLVNGHPGDSCGTEYFTHYAGDVAFTADTFTMKSTVSTRKKTDTCKDQVISDETIDPQDVTKKWRMQDGNLLVTDESGTESTYQPE